MMERNDGAATAPVCEKAAAACAPAAPACAPAAPAAPGGVDAVLTGRLSRRSFVALAAAGALSLAGCAAQGPAAQGPVSDGPAAPGGAGQSQGDGTGVSTSDSQGEAPQGEAAQRQEPVSLSTFAFNTLCTVTAYGVGEDAVRACLAACPRYEDLFSARKEGTDVARLNAAQGEPVEVDPDTADLLGRALELAESCEGAFDPTVGAVSLLWDFPNAVKPSDDALAAALPHVGWRNLHVEGTLAWLDDPLAKVDLGGIAKGWICGRLARMLAEAGCTSGLVNLGTSSIAALGSKPDGSPWRVGLRDPLDSMASLAAVVQVAGECITSSGLYDQRFEQDGVGYWHILDPSTGYPVQTDVLGDTLICADPVEGDALSTVLFVKGADEGRAWVEAARPDVAALFMCDDGRDVCANGFEDHGYEPVQG